MHRRDMMMLAAFAEPAMRYLENGLGIGGIAQRLAHALVVERLDRVDTRHRGIGRVDRVDLDVRQLLDRRAGRRLHPDRSCRPASRRAPATWAAAIVAEIDDLEALDMRTAAPMAALAGDELRSACRHRARPSRTRRCRCCPRRTRRSPAGSMTMQRIVEEGLGNAEVGRLAGELDGEVVDLLDGVGVPQPRRLLQARPCRHFSAVSNSSRMKPFSRPTDGRAGLDVEHALQVPDDVVGGELAVALAPRHVLRRCSVQVLRSGLASHFSTRFGRVTLSMPV